MLKERTRPCILLDAKLVHEQTIEEQTSPEINCG